jgi:antirestriction protein ArdC
MNSDLLGDKTVPKLTTDAIRREITTKMIVAIENGLPPWRRPWSNLGNGGLPCNFVSKRRYTGINNLLLSLVSEDCGFESRHWGTAAAWCKRGARLIPGQKATQVVFTTQLPKRNRRNGAVVIDSKGRERRIFFMRLYPLFNVAQVRAVDTTGQTKETLLDWAERYLPARQRPRQDLYVLEYAAQLQRRIEERLAKYKAIAICRNSDPDFGPAERLIKATKVQLRHGGDKSYYHQGSDGEWIQVPRKGCFDSITDYYQTVFHELMHWTVNGGRVKCPNRTYAFIELVAEIGACFVLHQLGVPLAKNMLENSQRYVVEWLIAMGADHKYVFDAAALASKGSDYLLGQINETEQNVA